jgi:hypothetical protein
MVTILIDYPTYLHGTPASLLSKVYFFTSARLLLNNHPTQPGEERESNDKRLLY